MIRYVLLAALAVGLGACAAPSPSGTVDPYEATNRAWFDANLRLAGTGGEAPRPNPFRRAAANAGANLSVPSSVLNDLLQVRPLQALENTLRFAINSTVGLAGLFDPASAIGLHGRRNDFGETLHRYGMGEGAYLVLPLVGPTTERDALGMAVDLALDPLQLVTGPRGRAAALAVRGGGRLAGAAENADLLDANVIDTADPYAQARLLYLQTRRYHLGIESDEEFIDPYADF